MQQISPKSFLGIWTANSMCIWAPVYIYIPSECIIHRSLSMPFHAFYYFIRHCLPITLLPHTQNEHFSACTLRRCFHSFRRCFRFFHSDQSKFISLIMNDFHKNHVIDDVSRFSNGFSIYRLILFHLIFFYTLLALRANDDDDGWDGDKRDKSISLNFGRSWKKRQRNYVDDHHYAATNRNERKNMRGCVKWSMKYNSWRIENILLKRKKKMDYRKSKCNFRERTNYEEIQKDQ